MSALGTTHAGPAKAAGFSQQEMENRVAEAVAQAQTESDESISDLLVCLGQEERKVEILRERLQQAGVDVDTLLESIAGDEEKRGDAEDFS